MAETDHHRILMNDLIQTLEAYYAAEPMVYVSGNLLLFYEEGNKRRHLSPDVFVVKGVPKRERLNYLTWEEKKGPDVVIELTSSSTRREDTHKKQQLYQDTLRVPEYFLFDPFGDYLHPALQGYRLRQGKYAPIKPAAGRLPSKVLGLHLEQQGPNLRLFDPATQRLLPTVSERVERAELGQQRAELALQRAELALQRAEFENERLRHELEDLRRRPEGQS
jgi:Uma2 family endonuclease